MEQDELPGEMASGIGFSSAQEAENPGNEPVLCSVWDRFEPFSSSIGGDKTCTMWDTSNPDRLPCLPVSLPPHQQRSFNPRQELLVTYLNQSSNAVPVARWFPTKTSHSANSSPELNSQSSPGSAVFGGGPPSYRLRSGLTLVEILIALTMTLIVLFAMAQAFQFASGEIASGRAVLEMSNRLRNAQQLLRTDLAGLTCDVRPHTETPPNGYLEYVEGRGTDKTPLSLSDSQGYLGDVDDILAFTSRNLDGSFRGRFSGAPIQSSFAEIVWFTEINDRNSDGLDTDGDLLVDYADSVTLFRRVLLIRPDLNTQMMDSSGNQVTALAVVDSFEEAIEFFKNNDISARYVFRDGEQNLIVANSLSDLSRREFRFARTETSLYPHPIDTNLLSQTKMGSSNGFSGDDILLTDVAAFDLRIFSPNAGVDLVDLDADGNADTAVQPADIGYVGLNVPSTPTRFASRSGSYVDLGSDPDNNLGSPMVRNNEFERGNPRKPFFTTNPHPRSQRFEVRNPASAINADSTVPDFYFCTWTPYYESDGFDQDDSLDNTGLQDEGTNGLDDDNRNGVDDAGERETAPPYPFPVRGIEVTFRIIEKNTREVRQTSVVQSFLPQ